MGDIEIHRGYRYCERCRRGEAAFDQWAGLQRDSLTPRGRRMAVLAGSRQSYDRASEDLWRLCGIRVSDQTIRRACEGVGDQADSYLRSRQATAEMDRQNPDDPSVIETSVDGAKVNTIEGWREIRAVLACRREAGKPAGIRQWDRRYLPSPHVKAAFATLDGSEALGDRWRAWADTMHWGTGQGVSVVADGAAWIWKQACEHLPDHEGVVDIYHVLEHLHAASRAMHSRDREARQWAEHQRRS